MTPEDAWQEEAYDRMVAEVLNAHKDDIVNESVSERMGSYYRDHPDLTAPAEAATEEARNLVNVSPAASLVFSRSAAEITLSVRPRIAGVVSAPSYSSNEELHRGQEEPSL